MTRSAPLYTLPNAVFGCPVLPNGMPPAYEAANVGAGVIGGGLVPLPSEGARESPLSHAASATTRAANTGARSRAIRRDSLKVYVILNALERGYGSELRASIWGERDRTGPAGCLAQA